MLFTLNVFGNVGPELEFAFVWLEIHAQHNL